MNRFVLFLAQGLFIGRIPAAPGTFGSMLGLLWVQTLLWTGNAWGYALGTLVGIGCSVWFCGRAERILGLTDPGSVVLDEIVAMPVCFAGWLILLAWRDGKFPDLSLFSGGNWLWTIGIFVAFRIFDVAKPWPIGQSQALAGGWGVTVDDLLAAVYVNLAVAVVWWGVSLKLRP